MTSTKKLFSWLIILVLSVSTIPAMAKEKVVLEGEELIEMFKTNFGITNPYDSDNPDYNTFYETVFEYKFVSEDGKIEKWYPCMEESLDGLTNTGIGRPVWKWDYISGDECDILEEHAHLHFDIPSGLMIPSFNESEFDKDGRYRLSQIVKINKEALKILYDYKLYRIQDNIPYMQIDLTAVEKFDTLFGIVSLIPQKIEDNIFELEQVLNENKEPLYTNDMDGYLIQDAQRFADINFYDPNSNVYVLKQTK